MAIKPEILKSWGPGGWSFYEPAADWHAPGPLENTFDKQVANIVAMRKQNPQLNLPTDPPTVAAELEAYTEARWAKTYSKAGMVKFRVETQEDKKKESRFTRSLRHPLSAAAGLAGIDIRSLEEWLGAGGVPVGQAVADQRAAVCAPCPANKKAGWRELLTVPAAIALKAYLEAKYRMKLATPMDADLGSCSACHCVLELKTWQPIEFIKENTREEVFEAHRKANANCWVLSEINPKPMEVP